MKGIVSTVIMIVVILALLLVLVALLIQSQGLIDVTSPEEILRIARLPELVGSNDYGSAPVTPDFTGDSGDTTSTEVSCAIAKSIEKDFMSYGYGTRSPAVSGFPQTLGKADPYRVAIAAGMFRINVNPATGNFWTYSDLSGTPLQNLISSCSDTGTLVPCSTPYMDEKCLSALLSNFKEGDNFLCTGINSARILVQGGGLQYFGNQKCGDAVADGQDNCKDLCPGGSENNNKVSIWKAPKVLDGPPPAFVTDAELATKGFPPQQCEGSKCTPLYMWALMWNEKKGEKNWEMYTTRVVETVDLGQKDMLEFAKELLSEPKLMTDYSPDEKVHIATQNTRKQKAGVLYPEFRTVWDVTVQPTSSVTVAQFIETFQKKLGKLKFGAEIEMRVNPEAPCISDSDCLTQPGDVTTKKWVQANGALGLGIFKILPVAGQLLAAGEEGMAGGGEDNPAFDQRMCIKNAQEYNTVNFRTNVPLTESLVPGHTYRVVMRWWDTTRIGDWGGQSCGAGFPGQKCALCVEYPSDWETERSCVTNYRWEVDCLGQNFANSGANAPSGSSAWNVHRDITRWQEYRLIIIDETASGEESS